jgi:hypothetical protein
LKWIILLSSLEYSGDSIVDAAKFTDKARSLEYIKVIITFGGNIVK